MFEEKQRDTNPPLRQVLWPDGLDINWIDLCRLTMLLRSRFIFWSWSCIFRAADNVSPSSWHSFSPFRVFSSSVTFPLSVKLQFNVVAMLRSCSCKVWADVSSCENCLMKASRASASKEEQQCCISREFPTKWLSLAETTKLNGGTICSTFVLYKLW